jgi:hypothetical protein
VQIFPSVICLDAEKLLDEAKEKNVPFNVWPKWVEFRLNEIML